MTEINRIILELIEKNKSVKDICLFLGITQKQFYVRLRQIINYGYQLKPRYQYNGDVKYIISNKLTNKSNKISIQVPKDNELFRCIVVSDTHIGNLSSDIELMKYIYDYASKNNVTIIFNCGDIIEGEHSCDKKSQDTLEKQMSLLINKHPYDENIRNFVIFGNHDCHSLYYDGIDISCQIFNYRNDIVPIGYGKGVVNIKDDSLLLQHELSVMSNPVIKNNSRLALVGHGHMMKTKLYDKLYICVPSLSWVSPDRTKRVVPGFIDMTIDFNDNKFDFVELKHLIIDSTIYQISESKCRMSEIGNFNEKIYSKTKGK